MKLLHMTFRFEFSEGVEKILDENEIKDYLRCPMMEGKDRDGKHYGSQVFPGNTSVFHAEVPDEKVDKLLSDLRAFRDAKEIRHHIRVLVLPIEKTL